MNIEIDDKVYMALLADIKPSVVFTRDEAELYCKDYVAVFRKESHRGFAIPLKVSEIDKAESFVVTDNVTENENEKEIGSVRCDTLAEAINAMVNGLEGKTEVTFYTELCADFGSVIEGVARWSHPARYADGQQWN